MVDEARNRTKVWLDEYIDPANVLEDDEVTEASIITHYAKPPYPLRRVFFDDKDVDVTFSIGQPRSSPSDVDWDGSVIGYNEKVPIEINTVDKADMTGNLLLEKAEAELRRVIETYPLGSYRSFTSTTPAIKDMGSWRLYGITYTLTYERDKT